MTPPVSTTPLAPQLLAAPVTSTADSVATETERMDNEILVEQNTEAVTLSVSSTPVPPHVSADRTIAASCVGRVGIEYVYPSQDSPAGETPKHVSPALEEPTSSPPADS